MSRFQSAALLLALLLGCRPDSSSDRDQLVEGVLCRGFELQVFRQHGTTDTLAAGGITDDVFRSVNDFQRKAGNGAVGWPTIPLHVHWRGYRAGPGAYGHLGQYRFAFFVRSVVSLQVAPDSACNWARNSGVD